MRMVAAVVVSLLTGAGAGYVVTQQTTITTQCVADVPNLPMQHFAEKRYLPYGGHGW